MNTYAKIDENGDVIEFPYRLIIENPIAPNEDEIPEDAVLVDTLTNRPTGLMWYQGAWFDTVERDGDNYVVTYTTGEKRWANDEEKKKTLETLIRMAKMDINKLQDEDAKASNLAVLDTIDVNDTSTYDNYHNLTL